jgi:hypothetical protein
MNLWLHEGIYNVAVKDSMNNGAEAWTLKRKEKKTPGTNRNANALLDYRSYTKRLETDRVKYTLSWSESRLKQLCYHDFYMRFLLFAGFLSTADVARTDEFFVKPYAGGIVSALDLDFDILRT